MAALFWFLIFIICLPVVIGGVVSGDLQGLLLPTGLILAVLAVRTLIKYRRRPRLSRRAEQLVSRALYHGRPEDQR